MAVRLMLGIGNYVRSRKADSLFLKMQHALWRTTVPSTNLFVFILMYFSCWLKKIDRLGNSGILGNLHKKNIKIKGWRCLERVRDDKFTSRKYLYVMACEEHISLGQVNKALTQNNMHGIDNDVYNLFS